MKLINLILDVIAGVLNWPYTWLPLFVAVALFGHYWGN